MTDIMTIEERSKLMSKVKNKNTDIEMLVRKRLFAMGFRYRVNVTSLPGRPDIVLKKYHSVVFVNGCFWHGHNCKEGHLPKSNVAFWQEKIAKNMERDERNWEMLQSMGWNVIVIWECELNNFEESIAKILDSLLSRKCIGDKSR